MKSRRPIICLDFDGVVHSYTSGWQGVAVIPDPPVEGFIEWIAAAYVLDQVEIHIHSSRSKSIRGRFAMKQWLARYLYARYGNMAGPRMDVLADEIVQWVKWPWFKPGAVVTIDDRAMTFDGNWHAPHWQPEALLKFVPWNKRNRVS